MNFYEADYNYENDCYECDTRGECKEVARLERKLGQIQEAYLSLRKQLYSNEALDMTRLSCDDEEILYTLGIDTPELLDQDLNIKRLRNKFDVAAWEKKWYNDMIETSLLLQQVYDEDTAVVDHSSWTNLVD